MIWTLMSPCFFFFFFPLGTHDYLPNYANNVAAFHTIDQVCLVPRKRQATEADDLSYHLTNCSGVSNTSPTDEFAYLTSDGSVKSAYSQQDAHSQLHTVFIFPVAKLGNMVFRESESGYFEMLTDSPSA
ncbi:hypothetical protein F4804DRAFT_299250 [Jackrogersella minutella]|nr:hypothetical protein F4804DRAFT_299250 [Jackrogersella minutella]